MLKLLSLSVSLYIQGLSQNWVLLLVLVVVSILFGLVCGNLEVARFEEVL